MATAMRWRYGETNPVVLPVASDAVIEIGDLVYFDSGDRAFGRRANLRRQAWPPRSRRFTTSSPGRLAMQQSRAGDTQDIRVATTGRVRVCLCFGHVQCRRSPGTRQEHRRHGAVGPASDRGSRRRIPSCRSAIAPSRSIRRAPACWSTWWERSATSGPQAVL